MQNTATPGNYEAADPFVTDCSDDGDYKMLYDDDEPDENAEASEAKYWSGLQWAEEAGRDADEPMREALDTKTWREVRRFCRQFEIDLSEEATFGDLEVIPAVIAAKHTGVTLTRTEVADFSADLVSDDPNDIGERLRRERSKRLRERDRVNNALKPKGISATTLYTLAEVTHKCGDDLADRLRVQIDRHNRKVWNTAKPHHLTERLHLITAGDLIAGGVDPTVVADMAPAAAEDQDTALGELAVARQRHHYDQAARARGPVASDLDDGPLYVDIGQLLDSGLPEPPQPDILHRADGIGLFYRGEINQLYGDPEDGKTMVALAGCAEVLRDAGTALFVDLDDNGVESIVSRLIMLGATKEALQSGRFRYCCPSSPQQLEEAITDNTGDGRVPDIAVIDCVGELLPMFGGSNDSADDFTRIIRTTAAPLSRAGSCVVLIDHLAKGKGSRDYGSGGTMAKRRRVGGTQLRVSVDVPLRKGQGGSLWLGIRKDRHSGLRQHCPAPPPGNKDALQSAGIFTIDPGDTAWGITTDPFGARAAQFGHLAEYINAAGTLDDGWTVTDLAKRTHGEKPTSTQRKATERAVKNLAERTHGTRVEVLTAGAKFHPATHRLINEP